jgi:hypothetical protein
MATTNPTRSARPPRLRCRRLRTPGPAGPKTVTVPPRPLERLECSLSSMSRAGTLHLPDRMGARPLSGSLRWGAGDARAGCRGRRPRRSGGPWARDETVLGRAVWLPGVTTRVASVMVPTCAGPGADVLPMSVRPVGGNRRGSAVSGPFAFGGATHHRNGGASRRAARLTCANAPSEGRAVFTPGVSARPYHGD